MTCRDIVRKLATLGCREVPRRGGGSYRRWINPANNRTTMLPDHGSRDIKLKTLRSALTQLEIDRTDFDNA